MAAHALHLGCKVALPPGISVCLPAGHLVAGLGVGLEKLVCLVRVSVSSGCRVGRVSRRVRVIGLVRVSGRVRVRVKAPGVLGALVVRDGRFEESGWACLTLHLRAFNAG